jgi:MFS family permease
LSDNQIALLQGMGVALPVALGAVPLGLMADRVSRARMVLFLMTLALISCVLSALAPGFLSLLAVRVLAGLSAAGLIVAAYSMAGDLFAPMGRGRATMVMAIGELGGAPAAFAVGGALLVTVAPMSSMGWKVEEWRLSLLCMGGLLVPVLLLMLLLREPGRGDRMATKPKLRAVWPELWLYRAVAMPLQLGRATLFIADGAVYVWGAPLFVRKYHLPADRVGAIMGIVLLAGGLLGPALGGPLVDFCQRHGGPRRVVTVMAGVALLSAFAATFALMPDANLAGLTLAIFLILGFTIAAASLALSIIVIPSELRGLNLGIGVVVGSLFFAGLAPLAVSGLAGMLGGEAMIAKALSIVCVTMSLLTAAIFIIARLYFPELRHEVVSDRRELKSNPCMNRPI